MSLNLKHLCPALGAEIRDLDLAQPISEDQFAQIRGALNDNDGVLVFRGQRLTPDQQINFSRRFGELFGDREQLQDTVAKYLLPGYPQIFRASNKIVDGEPQGRIRAGNYWHSDVSFRPKPAMVSLLHAIEVPPLGGDTLFTNMYLAYESLSPAMQKFLGGLHARHDFAVNTAIGFAQEQIEKNDLKGQNSSEHPVIRTHDETERKCLFVNPGNTSHMVGLHTAESKLLLEFLFEQSTRPEFVFRHSWQQGDLVIWDNRCTMHYAIADYEEIRHMHRTTVIGEVPC